MAAAMAKLLRGARSISSSQAPIPAIRLRGLQEGVAPILPHAGSSPAASAAGRDRLMHTVPIRLNSSDLRATQRGAPLPPTPEEYILSVKEVLTTARSIEEGLKLQRSVFWVLSACLLTAAVIGHVKLTELKDRNAVALKSLEDAKNKLAENRKTLHILKNNMCDLEEMKTLTPMPPPAPASPAALISPHGMTPTPLNRPPAADEA